MAEVAVAPIVNEGSPMMLIGVDKVLQVIGFESEAERTGISMQTGLGRFEDFRYLVEKDIRDMADEFGKRAQANGQIVFVLGLVLCIGYRTVIEGAKFQTMKILMKKRCMRPSVWLKFVNPTLNWLPPTQRQLIQENSRMNVNGLNGRRRSLTTYRSSLG